jgi:hypothetical protein
METYGGRKKRVSLADLKWKRPMGTLSVKIVDGKTGQQVHARIQGLAADGKFYAPRDAYSRIGSSTGNLFHTSGSYTVDMPPGRFKLQVVHGFEYWPKDIALDIAAGAQGSHHPARPHDRHARQGLAQRVLAQPYELRRQPAEYPGESHFHGQSGRCGRG